MLVGLYSLGSLDRTPGLPAAPTSKCGVPKGAPQMRHWHPKAPLLLCKGQQRRAQTSPLELQTSLKITWARFQPITRTTQNRLIPRDCKWSDPNSTEVHSKAHYLHLALALALCSRELRAGTPSPRSSSTINWGGIASIPKQGTAPDPSPPNVGASAPSQPFRLGPIEGNNITRTASLD